MPELSRFEGISPNGIAYANSTEGAIEIKAIKPLPDKMMIITFTSGEQRVYDGTRLLQYPAFAPLADEDVFMQVTIDDGIATWCNGTIDIAPEVMYRDSYSYSPPHESTAS